MFDLFKSKRLILLAFGILPLIAVSCGGDETETVVPPPSESAPKSSDGQALRLSTEGLNLNVLTEHENRIVANNAKGLMQAFERNDYSKAAYSISTIASLSLDPAAERVVQNTLVHINTVATKAAEAGDANAEFAVNHLQNVFTR